MLGHISRVEGAKSRCHYKYALKLIFLMIIYRLFWHSQSWDYVIVMDYYLLVNTNKTQPCANTRSGDKHKCSLGAVRSVQTNMHSAFYTLLNKQPCSRFSRLLGLDLCVHSFK